MGYFSNGSQGEAYQAYYCYRCLNWQDKGDGRGEGCAIWDAHLLTNYTQHKNEAVESILSVLIPRVEGGENAQCAQFIERKDDAAS